ncbi:MULTISPECIES: sporulation protein YjcZ [Beduini]|uniref:sporulation protein YjcZ n=1 Tax=Beduini TaxID=1922299 RepID=UPI000942305C|nr:sporulation protein YjcZ [Beduini massiliensis]
MNCGYNYTGCGCQSYCNPCSFYPVSYGCGGGCGGFGGGCGGFGGGSSWFAIVLVVFLLLIICGCTKIC